MPEIGNRFVDSDLRLTRDLVWIKRAIWLYFWLLILEGAIRNWILPAFSAPLLIVRDPVVLFIYWKAFRHLKPSGSLMVIYGMVCAVMIFLAGVQVSLGISTPVVAAFGLRSYLLYLPLIWVIVKVMDINDVKRFGYWLLVISIPMTILMVLQYNANPGSWLNVGAGGGRVQGYLTGEFTYSGVRLRPAGTFSYPNGIACLIPFFVAFLVYAITHPRTYWSPLVWASAVATAIAMPVSVNRTAWFTSGAVILWSLLIGFTSPKYTGPILRIGLVIAAAAVAATQFPIFQDALQASEDRWNNSTVSEGGFSDIVKLRILNVFSDGFDAAGDVDLIGRGIGMGSNVAATLMSGDKGFLLAEVEWSRVVQECGPLVGLMFLAFRVGIALHILGAAIGALGRDTVLSWILAPAALPILLMTTMEQPTHLGFITFGCGICLAAAKPLKPRFITGTLSTIPATAFVQAGIRV